MKMKINSLLLISLILVLSQMVCVAQYGPDSVKMKIVPGHPWRPPFGLDRVGSPPDVLVSFTLNKQPDYEYFLISYRKGKEINRQKVNSTFNNTLYLQRLSLDPGIEEVALIKKSSKNSETSELSRQKVTLPLFEAEAVAKPDSVINPVDLGTILVPHDWLLLAGGQKATIDVVALNRHKKTIKATGLAWLGSDSGNKVKVSLTLNPDEKKYSTMILNPVFNLSKTDTLHVKLVYSEGKELWQKSIPVMRIPNPPSNPKFGAIATKLRYDLPIPVKDNPNKINYNDGWDPERKDVVVFFPNGARFVFWRGSSYCPFWASQSNTGFCYEWAELFTEHGIKNVIDCIEPLQDKELRYGRVEIVETTTTRVHLRWSYQSCDLDYRVGNSYAVVDYFFYPDGFGTRVLTLTANPGNTLETNEFIIFTPPSAHPFDILPEKLVDILWPDGKAEIKFPFIQNQQQETLNKLNSLDKNIQLLHRIKLGKNESMAAICYSPWGSTQDLPGFAPFSDEGVLVTPMYWGNHWPFSRGYPTRFTISDRISEAPAHNSSMHAGTPKTLRTHTGEMPDAQGKLTTMQRDTWVWLIGMTDADDDELRQWAKSFSIQSPGFSLIGAKSDTSAYSPERRSIRLIIEKPEVRVTVKPNGFYVNPVFELNSVPGELRNISINGKPLNTTDYAWDGKTLWLNITISKKTELQLVFNDK